MNRLVVIGNGFDLAHRMPTRYYDFVRWYLVSIFSSIKHGKNYEDDGIEIHRTSWGMYETHHLLDFIKNDPIDLKYLSLLFENDSKTHEEYARLPFWVTFKFPFLKKIFKIFSDKNWVDIEVEFYKSLLEIAALKDQDVRNKEVDYLNKSLDFVKQKLEEYLTTLPLPGIKDEIVHILASEIDNDEIVGNEIKSEKPLSNLFLNFNYTRTIDEYLNHLRTWNRFTNFENLFIHGELNKRANPLIFGFGDEMDDNYRILEKMNYNGFLDNMKSFGYFKTQNYHQLIRFIENEEFQVFVLGHSCGLSDRVMLNMIFEHHNCKSIKLFYHQKGNLNNFKILTQDISRHFNKKNDLRRKLVPFDQSQPLSKE